MAKTPKDMRNSFKPSIPAEVQTPEQKPDLISDFKQAAQESSASAALTSMHDLAEAVMLPPEPAKPPETPLPAPAEAKADEEVIPKAREFPTRAEHLGTRLRIINASLEYLKPLPAATCGGCPNWAPENPGAHHGRCYVEAPKALGTAGVPSRKDEVCGQHPIRRAHAMLLQQTYCSKVECELEIHQELEKSK